MLQSLTFRRTDGTLVGQVNGLPYHIIQSDPLWPVAQAIAADMGDELPFEPAPPMPAPRQSPQDVSVWQFMMAAWKMGFITQAEALAAVKDKVMPPTFAAALADLPEENQAEAQLKFAGITRMVRSDPLFALVIGSGIATGAQVDAVFTLADSIA